MDIETLLLSAPWITVGLWIALYLADRMLTIAIAREYRLGAGDHVAYEGSLELTPMWMADVDALRWFSPRFARVLILSALVVGGLCLIGGPFLSARNDPYFRNLALGSLGFLFFPEFAVCARHAGNLAAVRRMNSHEGVDGKVTYARWLTYETSAISLWGLAGVLLVCAFLGWKASLFGGAFGVASLGLSHVRSSRVQLAKSNGLPQSRRASLPWTVLSLFVVLLIGFAVWQSFPTDAPKPPAGAIWFGTGYDSGLPGLTGRANTFSQGTTVWMTADLDESNQPLTNVDVVILMVDRVPSTSDIPRGHQLFSVVVPGRLDVGPHTVSIEDVGGRVRATGTFTVTAAPVDSNGGG